MAENKETEQEVKYYLNTGGTIQHARTTIYPKHYHRQVGVPIGKIAMNINTSTLKLSSEEAAIEYLAGGGAPTKLAEKWGLEDKVNALLEKREAAKRTGEKPKSPTAKPTTKR